MDVRCAKCGIEYEFDDAKVTAAGVTVKCTNCGHVFKVKREEAGSVPPSPSTSFGQVMPVPAGAAAGFNPNSTFAKGMDGGEWMVKRVDGQVFRFKELTTLQKWIVERKVGRDDEISKTGKTWKKLGEIAELASFFQVVEFERDRHLTAVASSALFGDIAASYVIVPRGAATCRLVVKLLVRHRSGPLGRITRALLPWGDLVMMRKQLLTLKTLAEGGRALERASE